MDEKNGRHSGFFRRGINYSACNEDGRSEAAFLGIAPGDAVCCILGGGERFFNLLIGSGPGISFDLVDANPAQIHLLKLKAQAYLGLEYAPFSGFLGLTPMPARQRLGIYLNTLRPRLEPEARAFWDRRERVIGAGVLYAGKFERFMALMGFFLSLAYGKRLTRLFRLGDAEAKLEIDRLLAGKRWNLMTWLLCQRVWFRLLSGDPAFYAHADIGSYRSFFKRTLEGALRRHPVRGNFLLALIFCGRYLPESGTVPECYRPEHFQAIGARLAHTEYRLHCLPLEAFLRDFEGEFDAFSLSDVASYTDAEGFRRLLDALGRSARAGARIAMRQLLTRYETGGRAGSSPVGFERFSEEELRLEAADSSFIWKFILLCKTGDTGPGIPEHAREASAIRDGKRSP